MKKIMVMLTWMYSCLGFSAQPLPEESVTSVSSVPEIKILKSKNNNVSYDVHAVITSETQATLSSPMAGYIQRLYIEDGSYFKKGDLLLRFDCRLQEYNLQKAEAEVKQQEVNQASYARLAELGSASNMKVAESQADLARAIAERDVAVYQKNDCEITAPFDGQVTELYVHQNETVQTYQKLFDIFDNKDLTVKVLVPSNWVDWLNVGDTFELTINETGKTYIVKVTYVVNRVDAVSRSVKVIGDFSTLPEGLRSGMSGTARFSGP